MLAHHRDRLSSSSFAWSSIALSICEWAFRLLEIWCLRLPRFESCACSRWKLRVSFRFGNRLSVPRASKLTTTNIYVYIGSSDFWLLFMITWNSWAVLRYTAIYRIMWSDPEYSSPYIIQSDVLSHRINWEKTMSTKSGFGHKIKSALAAWAPSQYKDRLIYVWRFPC